LLPLMIESHNFFCRNVSGMNMFLCNSVVMAKNKTTSVSYLGIFMNLVMDSSAPRISTKQNKPDHSLSCINITKFFLETFQSPQQN
jgi:hypothetical protein